MLGRRAEHTFMGDDARQNLPCKYNLKGENENEKKATEITTTVLTMFCHLSDLFSIIKFRDSTD